MSIKKVLFFIIFLSSNLFSMEITDSSENSGQSKFQNVTAPSEENSIAAWVNQTLDPAILRTYINVLTNDSLKPQLKQDILEFLNYQYRLDCKFLGRQKTKKRLLKSPKSRRSISSNLLTPEDLTLAHAYGLIFLFKKEQGSFKIDTEKSDE